MALFLLTVGVSRPEVINDFRFILYCRFNTVDYSDRNELEGHYPLKSFRVRRIEESIFNTPFVRRIFILAEHEATTRVARVEQT